MTTPYTATIKSEGVIMPPEVELLKIEVRRELGRIPEAKLVLVDGSVAAGEFRLSNRELFAPGKAVQILVRYGDDADVQLFAGLVVRHAVEVREGASELRVELKDRAIVLTRARRSATYVDQRDDEVIRARIAAAGLEVGAIDRTSVTHRELVQQSATDWDFLVARADVNGLLLCVDDGTITARSMSAAPPPAARYTYGLDAVHSFDLELDGGGQWHAITGAAWDGARGALARPIAGRPLTIAAGNLDVDRVAAALGGDTEALLLPAPLGEDEVRAWADARLARSRLSLLRGRLVVAGDAARRPLDRVALAGVGERFDGVHLVRGVTQRIDPEGWWTELELGLSPEWFARRPDVADVPAGGLLPPATQLQLGVVAPFEEDPEGDERLRVELPGIGPLWARIARPDAGEGRGFCFAPEPGDPVVVGFLAGDPRQAVVLGSLFGAGSRPPAGGAVSEANSRRLLVSRSGVKITFDDDKKSLTLETPAGNVVAIDDDAGSLELRDQHGAAITLDRSGVRVKSAGDLTLEASGRIVIKGAAVDIQ